MNEVPLPDPSAAVDAEAGPDSPELPEGFDALQEVSDFITTNRVLGLTSEQLQELAGSMSGKFDNIIGDPSNDMLVRIAALGTLMGAFREVPGFIQDRWQRFADVQDQVPGDTVRILHIWTMRSNSPDEAERIDTDHRLSAILHEPIDQPIPPADIPTTVLLYA
jgi:hypothetical protein